MRLPRNLAASLVFRRIHAYFSVHPLLVVQSLIILLLLVLIVYPSVILLNESIRMENGRFSFVWYRVAYTDSQNFRAILNTLKIATGVGVIATLFGTFMAWSVVRTDTPGRRFIEMASIVPFISTPFIGALAWILLASPRTGLINQLWHFLAGSGPILNIYSMWGIILISSMYMTPFVFLIVSGALQSMDPSLEEASMSAGGGVWQTTFRVTLPLVLPAILSGSLLVFVLAAEQFGVPAVLGTPAKIRVLTTSIWEAISVYPPNYGLGAALCVTLLAIAMVGLYLQRRLLGSRSYTTVGGKGSRPRRISLGPLRYLTSGLCMSYLVLSVVLPYITLFLSSIRTIWTHDFRWEQFTLKNYIWVLFDYPITQRALMNSVMLAVVGATLCIIICSVISFLSIRTRLPGRRVLEYLSMLPMAFPGIVLAVGLLRAWITPPLVLYGTIWILLVAYVTRYIPYGVRSTSATLIQIHPELEESSLISGGNWLQTFRFVTLPLLKPGILAGWTLLFVAFTRELSASVMLYSPTHEVLSVAIYDMFEQGDFRPLSALAFIQVAIALSMLAVSKKVVQGKMESSQEIS